MPEEINCPNCINCSIGPIVQFTRVLGLPYINISCKHKNNISKTYITYSKFCLFTCILIVVALIIATVYYYFHIRYIITVNTGELFDIVILFPGFTGSCAALGTIICSALQAPNIIKVAFKAEKLAHTWRRLKGDILLDVEDVRYLRGRNFLHLLLIFIIICVATLLLFSRNSDVEMPIVVKLTIIVALYIEMLVFSILIILIHIDQKLQGRIYLYLKADLDFVLNKNRFSFNRRRRGKLNLKESLSMNCQFHTYNLNILRNACTYVSPSATFYVFDFALIFISIFFIVLDCVLNGNLFKLFTPQLLFFELHLLVSGLTFFYTIYLCGCWTEVIDESLEYLHRYPINKLCRDEASQLELLIKTLYIQKPAILLSDVIPIHKNLYAVVAGVVLTYVLNLIQLQDQWNKNKHPH